MDVYYYIDNYLKGNVYTIKQLRFIENIFIYVDDLTVYKVVIGVNPLTLNKSKKYGLHEQFIIYDNVDRVLLKEDIKGTSKGKYMYQYKPYNREINVWLGEEYALL